MAQSILIAIIAITTKSDVIRTKCLAFWQDTEIEYKGTFANYLTEIRDKYTDWELDKISKSEPYTKLLSQISNR